MEFSYVGTMTSDDGFEETDELESAVSNGVSEALKPLGWGALGAFTILFGLTLASAVDESFGGILMVPALIVVLFGFYLVAFSVYELV